MLTTFLFFSNLSVLNVWGGFILSLENANNTNVFIKDDNSSSNFYVKLLNPLLAKIVGSIASVLFQHISYWSKTQKTNIVFRTNEELVSDLQGMYTASQIQYAKKKLIDNGMIEVSFNKGKKSWDRTTHYSITEKGKQYLINNKGSGDYSKGDNHTKNTPKHSVSEHSKAPSSNDSVSNVKISQSESKVPKTSVKVGVHNPSVFNSSLSKPSASAQGNNAAANTKDMKESFNKGFTNPKAVKCPDDILLKMGKVVKGSKVDTLNCDLPDDDLCEDDLDILEEMESVDVQRELLKSLPVDSENILSLNDGLSLAELTKKCFTRGVTEDREELFAMQQYKYSFVEDY